MYQFFGTYFNCVLRFFGLETQNQAFFVLVMFLLSFSMCVCVGVIDEMLHLLSLHLLCNTFNVCDLVIYSSVFIKCVISLHHGY